MEQPTVGPSLRRRRPRARVAGERETQAIAAALGRAIREWRRAHGVTLEQLAAQVGIGRSRLAQLELGKGGTAPLALWVATGLAIGRPLAVSFSRAVEDAPRDGGHLGVQELDPPTRTRAWPRPDVRAPDALAPVGGRRSP